MQTTPLLLGLALAGVQGCSSPASTGSGSGGQVGAGAGVGGSFTGGTTTTGGAPGAGHGGSAGSGVSSGGRPSTGGSSGSSGSSSGNGNAGGGSGGGSAGGLAGGSGGDVSGGLGGGGAGGSSGGAPPAGGMGGTAVAGGGAGGSAAGTGGNGGGPGCMAPTEYRNLFVTISGHTQAESDAKVQAAWNQLFNPSNGNTVYYDGPGSDESYVKDTGNNDVRTEGMSYGMITAVQLDKQTEFDRLWAWVKNHMAQGTTGEIAWHCSTSGSKQSTGGAPDGEEYMATALIFAHQRWGSTGRFDYAMEAQWVLDVIRTKYFNTTYHIVKFVSGSNNTDGSYVLPAFYQVWACFDTANADFWNEAVKAGREFFPKAADSNGVIPDQSSFTGGSMGSAGSDAKRCVMNIMMDANFFGADPWQTDTYAPAFANWMKSHSDNSAAQFSCNALLGFGVPDATGKSFVDKLWSAGIPTGTYRYYDGTLYMLGLLHVSGTFKLWF